MTSLPSQAKAGPRCPKCGREDFELDVDSVKRLACGQEFTADCLSDFAQFFQLPAPAALSVEEYATQFKWAVARFSENVDGAEWVTKTQALEFARHFVGAVGQPRATELPNWVIDYAIELERIQESRNHMLTDERGCKAPVLTRGTIVDTIRKYFARPSLPSESPAVPHAHEGFAAHITRFGEGVWDKNCPDCLKALNRTELAVPAAPEVPFSLPLMRDPDDCRDYIISAVNSHEGLKRERDEVMKALGITFDPELAAEEGDAHEVAAEPEPLYFDTLPKAVANTMALLDRECTKHEASAESLLSLNAELVSALKEAREVLMYEGTAPAEIISLMVKCDDLLDRAEKAVRP